MHVIELIRKSHQALGAKTFGMRAHNPVHFGEQQRAIGHHLDHLSLPAKLGGVSPMNLNAGADFGVIGFMVDYDPLDSAPIL